MNRISYGCCCKAIQGNNHIHNSIINSKGIVHTFLRWNFSLPLNGYLQRKFNPMKVHKRLYSYHVFKRNIYENLNLKLKDIHYSQRGLISIFSKYNNTKLQQTVSASNLSSSKSLHYKHKTVLIYLVSAAILTVGLSYAAVPLYRLYCQATGLGGTTMKRTDVGDLIEGMERIEDRLLTIRFEAGTSQKLQWKFKPQQKEVKLAPGETALAFYTAENLTDRPIIGISTYNVIPFEAGQYFNKIQCFCFEEQQLNPHEEVDMPVFFYIDPDFDEDPKMAKVDEIILSYTFFESNDGSAPVAVPHQVR